MHHYSLKVIPFYILKEGGEMSSEEGYGPKKMFGEWEGIWKIFWVLENILGLKNIQGECPKSMEGLSKNI